MSDVPSTAEPMLFIAHESSPGVQLRAKKEQIKAGWSKIQSDIPKIGGQLFAGGVFMREILDKFPPSVSNNPPTDINEIAGKALEYVIPAAVLAFGAWKVSHLGGGAPISPSVSRRVGISGRDPIPFPETQRGQAQAVAANENLQAHSQLINRGKK